jgi:hypothetical protein
MSNITHKVTQNGGVNINGGNVTIAGDVVGRDKVTTTSYGVTAGELAQLASQFAQIKQTIDQRADDPQVDKTELKELVERIEQEVKKGRAANPKKVERWLRFLAEMADDIFQVTVAALTHPVAGIAKAIQLIAQKAKEEAA